MLLTGRRLLPYSPRWNLGHFAYPICVVAVGYSLLVLSVAFVCFHTFRIRCPGEDDTDVNP